nr:YTH domain-containing family protein 2-like isoform X1 [Ipomoea batatas]
MAAVVPPSDEAAEELLQNLTLDSDNEKPLQATETTMKPSAARFAPAESGALANGINKPFEGSTTHSQQDFMGPSMFYNPNGYPSSTYYYRGYDGSSTNEWDRFLNPDRVELPPSMYGDYHHGYGYAPYGTYSPSGSHIEHDNQMYGAQQYQYPTTYFQSSTTNGTFSSNKPYAPQSEVPTSIAPDKVQLIGDTTKVNQSHVGAGTPDRTTISKPVRPIYEDSSLKSLDSYGWGSIPSANQWISSPVSHNSNFPSGTNQSLQPLPHLMGLQHPRASSGLGGYVNQMYPSNRMYGHYGNTFRSGLGLGPNSYLSAGSHDWLSVDNKSRSWGRGNGLFSNCNESVYGLNELNRGPRLKGFKDLKDSESITLAVKGQSLPLRVNSSEDNLPLFPDREQYNKDDFPETYTDAKFFVIKSYNEDDVHKSIKYGVWSSTPNGNKKLDEAYKEAQDKSGGCPVFLLFSVNASGQFVGLAEMVGRVDYDKTVEYWQQDKWNGCFPTKWHIIKDVPNSMLRHITLENNENKPVTNSRDTQEVSFEHGIDVLKILKGHSSKTSILDDFEFYEGRQKIMQEKKAKQRLLEKQAGNAKPFIVLSSQETDKTEATDKNVSAKPADSDGSAAPETAKADGGVIPHGEKVTFAAVLSGGVGNAC